MAKNYIFLLIDLIPLLVNYSVSKALKGHNTTAKGNALSTFYSIQKMEEALKGRKHKEELYLYQDYI